VYFLGAKVTYKFFKFSLQEILHLDTFMNNKIVLLIIQSDTKSKPNYE